MGVALRAAIYMIIAMGAIGIIDNYVFEIAQTISVWQFHAVRSGLAMPLILLLPLAGLGAARARHLGPLAIRSLLLSAAMVLYFASLGFMPLAQALAGMFSSPIFVQLMTAFWLKRTLGPWRVSAAFIGFAGTFLVLQPDPAALDPMILMPIGAGFLYAASSVYTREACAGESTVALLAGAWGVLGLIGLAGLLWLGLFPHEVPPGAEGFLTRGWVWPFGNVMPWIIIQVLGSLLATFLLTRAYQTGETSLVAVFEYSVMIFGPAWAWGVMGVALGPWQMIGIAMIITAGIVITLRSRRQDLNA